MFKFALFILLIVTEVYCSKPGKENVCLLKIQPGNCLALFVRYGFDQKLNQCREFIFGGCNGNDNNFETLEECRIVCPGFKA